MRSTLCTDAPAWQNESGSWFCQRCASASPWPNLPDMDMSPVTQDAIDARNATRRHPEQCMCCDAVLPTSVCAGCHRADHMRHTGHCSWCGGQNQAQGEANV